MIKVLSIDCQGEYIMTLNICYPFFREGQHYLNQLNIFKFNKQNLNQLFFSLYNIFSVGKNGHIFSRSSILNIV